MKMERISADQTLALRSLQLRNGWDLEKCRFDSDQVEGAMHLAVVDQEQAVCVLSLHPQSHSKLEGPSFQLRGMATHPDFVNKGLGKQLINFAIDILRETEANYLWCNARRIAYAFYEKQGFVYLSEEFEIPSAGPHREMYLALTK